MHRCTSSTSATSRLLQTSGKADGRKLIRDVPRLCSHHHDEVSTGNGRLPLPAPAPEQPHPTPHCLVRRRPAGSPPLAAQAKAMPTRPSRSRRPPLSCYPAQPLRLRLRPAGSPPLWPLRDAPRSYPAAPYPAASPSPL
jgi:hypothetical protein